MEAAAAADVPRQDAMMLMASRGNGNSDNLNPKTSSSDVGILGALGLAAAVLTSGGSSAVAASGMTQNVPSAPFEITATTGISIQSSTIQLSEAIKTMDFSLPSSYDTISDAKSAATDKLTVTVNAPTGGGGGKKAPKAKSSGGGAKQPAITSEERAALKAAREAQKEAEADAKAAARAADKEAAAAAAKAKQEAAVREAEKVAKQAEAKLKKEAAAEKEAKKAATVSSSVEFVDMGLPSYSNSAKTEGKKSAFSL